MTMGVGPDELVAAIERGDLASRCATDPCRALLGGVAGPGWTVGAVAKAGADRVLRLDHRDAAGVVPVWLRVGADDRVLAAAGLRGDPLAELAVDALPHDAWAAELRCGAPGSGACESLLVQARSKGATLRPLATWSAEGRRLALVDFVVAGRVEDRVWVYAQGDAAGARVAGADEDGAHGPPFLAGELPGDGGQALPPDAALAATAARWCAGEVPAPLADRALGACAVEAAGAIGGWGAVCLRLPSGDHLKVRVRQGAPAFGGYGSGCALTVGDLY